MARTITPTALTMAPLPLVSPSVNNSKSSSDTIEEIGRTLQTSLLVMLAQAQALEQHSLSSEEQARCIDHIQQLATEASVAINKLHNYVEPLRPTYSLAANIKNLRGVRALLIEDNNKKPEDLLILQLQFAGMECTKTEPDEALAILRSAEQAKSPYQIVIINAEHPDHHFSYLARTIKASSLLSPMMLVLTLSNELLAFEKERAYFDGFTTVLNPSRSKQLLEGLATSWRGWAVKMNFSHKEILPSQHRILLVEDEPIPQRFTRRQLEELGYKVDVAADGHSALKLLEQKLYDLVFMDIGLPDINGLEVTAEIRKRERGCHTPIIGLTAFGLPSDQESGLHAGMDEYLIKPLLPERLNIVLKCWLSSK